jgi:WD40-like Beta Propeller Repeat
MVLAIVASSNWETLVSVAAPPRPPIPEDPDALDALDALIEEARRRARRRRRRYGAVAVLAALAGSTAFIALLGGAGESRLPAALGEPRRLEPLAGPPGTGNGELTIMAVPVNSRQEGPPGWYGLSTIGPAGELRTVVRCPNRVEFCGEVESIDWSPNGRWLALAVTSFGLANPYNGIHVVDPGTGRDLQIRSCHDLPGECDWFDLDWSPDGSKIAYVSNHTISIIYVSPDGGGTPRVLQTGTAGHDSSPSWSPDGRWIAYSTRSGGDSSVSVIPVFGSAPRVVARRASYPAWSPTGTTLAVRRACGFRLIALAGMDVTPRRLESCLPGAPYRTPPHLLGPPTWSPDGTKLAFAVEGNRWSSAPHPYGTYVVNADGTGLTRVTTMTIGVHVGQQPRPAWRSTR